LFFLDLPTNGDGEKITELEKPLLIFINTKSGGKQVSAEKMVQKKTNIVFKGEELLPKFEKLHPKSQVSDIVKAGGPKPVLSKFKQVKDLRIL